MLVPLEHLLNHIKELDAKKASDTAIRMYLAQKDVKDAFPGFPNDIIPLPEVRQRISPLAVQIFRIALHSKMIS